MMFSVATALLVILAGCDQSVHSEVEGPTFVGGLRSWETSSARPETPRLTSFNNFRDLAGPVGYVTADGGGYEKALCG